MKKQVVALASFALTGAAFATDFMWKAAVDGNFEDEGNWEPTGVPGVGDAANFSLGGDTLDIWDGAAPDARTIGSVGILTGNYAFDLRGKTWNVQGDWTNENTAVASAPWTVLSNGTLNVAGSLWLSRTQIYCCGHLTVSGPSTAVSAQRLMMAGSNGSFLLNDGAQFACNGLVYVGGQGAGGSDNTFAVVGNGTRFAQTVQSEFQVGRVQHRNRIIVADGAEMTVASQLALSTSYGGRENELWVTNGATLNCCNGLYVGGHLNGSPTGGSKNQVYIAGADTSVMVTGFIYSVDNVAESNRFVITDGACVTQTVYAGDCGLYVRGTHTFFGIDNRATYDVVPSPAGSYHTFQIGGSENTVFVGSGARYTISRQANSGQIGSDTSSGHRLIVSNGTYNIATTWRMTVYPGNSFIFQGAAPSATFGDLYFNGSTLRYEPTAEGYAAAPFQVKNWFENTSATPIRVVVDVNALLSGDVYKLDLPLVKLAGSDWYLETYTKTLAEMKDNVVIEPADAREFCKVYVTDDNHELHVVYKKPRGLTVIIK